MTDVLLVDPAGGTELVPLPAGLSALRFATSAASHPIAYDLPDGFAGVDTATFEPSGLYDFLGRPVWIVSGKVTRLPERFGPYFRSGTLREWRLAVI